jgi:hypothetical protein
MLVRLAAGRKREQAEGQRGKGDEWGFHAEQVAP